MRLEILQKEEFYRVENARVVIGSDLFYDNELTTAYSVNPFNPVTDLLQEEIGARIKRSLINNNITFDFINKPADFGRINAQAFALSTIHPYNYFHFLIESLPILNNLLINDLIDKNSVVLTSHLHSNFYDALKIVMGSKLTRLLQMNMMDSVQFDELIIQPSPAHGIERIDGKTPLHIFDSQKLKALREVFKSYWDGNNPLKIMVTRRSGYRKLVNHLEVENIAKEKGFVVVQPENLSFIRQIKLFSNATHIIGPTGAWLSNLLFVKPSTKVTVLFPHVENSPPPSLWQGLGKCFDINVDDIYGDVFEFNPNQPIHSDFQIAPQLMLNLLSKE